MTTSVSLTVVYEPVEEGWTQATIEELPGVITAAPTLAEARELIVDALREWLLAFGNGIAPIERAAGSVREPLEIHLTA